MEEYVDILDDTGKRTGRSVLKSEAHRKGLLHPTAHVWLYTKKDELLFQRRAATKKTFPLLWDVSVAGHIAAGEQVETAALREVDEEVGLCMGKADLAKVGTSISVHRHPNNIVDAEFHHCFAAALTVPVASLKLQREEVEEVRLMGIKTIKQRLAARRMDGFVPISESYWSMLFTKLEILLK